MPQGWSVAGRRLEFGAAFPSGKLVVKHNGQVEHEQKLASQGTWDIPVDGTTYRLVRTKGFLAPKTELFSHDGDKVPPTNKLVTPSPAAAGSLCAAHGAAASSACARCGTFVCVQCAGPDRVHCQPCSERLITEAEKTAAAMAYLAPAPVLAIFGGLFLALLGAGAGLLAVFIAKRTESKALKIAAAVALYGVAVVVWLVLLAVLMPFNTSPR
ncbi:MAG: hypothetical protein K1X64_16275 [Myxococcaceae bacterium]|nr:hypothetical protein [Myxococcaceae bacterium]